MPATSRLTKSFIWGLDIDNEILEHLYGFKNLGNSVRKFFVIYPTNRSAVKISRLIQRLTLQIKKCTVFPQYFLMKNSIFPIKFAEFCKNLCPTPPLDLNLSKLKPTKGI